MLTRWGRDLDPDDPLPEHPRPHLVRDTDWVNLNGRWRYAFAGETRPEQWPERWDGDIVVPIQGNLRANNGDALLAAAIAGQGLIYQPTFIVSDSLRNGSLVPVLRSYPTYEPSIHAVLPSGRQAPAKVRAFVAFLAERFGPEPEWDRGL